MKAIERPFYYDTSLEILKRARELRKNLTGAEKVLWKKMVKNQINGLHFRAQHPISKFIVDFYCHEALLVIEIDGDIHQKEEVTERDEGREYELKKLGLKVLRFSNDDVFKDIEKVVRDIAAVVKTTM